MVNIARFFAWSGKGATICTIDVQVSGVAAVAVRHDIDKPCLESSISRRDIRVRRTQLTRLSARRSTMLPCYKPSHEPNQVEKLSPNLAGLGLKEK